ncbi:hypothetical protein [Bradyrhizobium sp. RDM4]|uniref:hypothetical protein n=1 Tax=Bradyrhizobium sp. RDM4 TaxID=3378765 RepID=UPI0038FC2944
MSDVSGKKQPPSAVSGLTVAFEILIEELIESGAVDKARLIGKLKGAYNQLTAEHHVDSPAAHILHTAARWTERGVKKR